MAKLERGVNDLATVNPELAKEWHPAKNGDLTPNDVTWSSGRKVWWKGSCGHEWQGLISNRVRGAGCPYCNNRLLLRGFNDLMTTHPDIANEWHPTKNDDLLPSDVTFGSSRKVWWLCLHGHAYEAKVYHRVRGSGCPYCSGQRAVSGVNDLKTMYPAIAAEWCVEKNGDVTPDMVLPASNRKFWWRDKLGHVWTASPDNRIRGKGCPYCANKKVLVGFNDLQSQCPDIAKEWHPEKNGELQPTMFTKGSEKKVWWLGSCGHEWQSSICNRVAGHGCPVCDATTKTSFAEQAIFYYLQQCFSDAVNRDVSFGKELDVYIPSKQIAVEYDGRRYHTSVERDEIKTRWCQSVGIRLVRIREYGCPHIDGDDVIVRLDDSDSSLNDVLLSLMKLLDLSFDDIDVCRDRTIIMNGYIVSQRQNSLGVQRPDLAEEWHPEKNGQLTPYMFAVKSNKTVWWLGKCGHEWQSKICNRVIANQGCPYCVGQRLLVGFNDLKTVMPQLAEEWDYEKNGLLLPEMVMRGSHKKVWWKCHECGHEWQARIVNRARSSGCPVCKNRRVGQKRQRAVVCVETGMQYESIKAAFMNTYINPSNISDCCRGKHETAGGYHWRYADELDLASAEESV